MANRRNGYYAVHQDGDRHWHEAPERDRCGGIFANLPHAVKAIRFDNVWAHGVISSAIISLQQQLADALLTARYQSDVSRQADEAREKAEQERDAVIATAADTIFTTTQTWVEKLAALQAENAGLRAGGVGLIAAERQRQIEGSSDDDRYNSGQLAQSAHGLLETALGLERDYIGFPLSCARKLARRHAGNPIKLLTIAGAFIAAEIDRLNRATPTPPQERQP
jgi:hypothetical protein